MFLKLMIAALVATGGAAVVGIGGDASKASGNKPKVQGGQTEGSSATPTVSTTRDTGGSPSGNPGSTGPGGGGSEQS